MENLNLPTFLLGKHGAATEEDVNISHGWFETKPIYDRLKESERMVHPCFLESGVSIVVSTHTCC